MSTGLLQGVERSLKLGLFMGIFIGFGCSSKPVIKPNFLVILVDDLGYHDLGVTGSDYYLTPNIDKIAFYGTKFTNGYATSSVCSPSRASLLTGQFTSRHGITDWIGAPEGENWRAKNRHTLLLPAKYNHYLRPEIVTLPESLRYHGYKTFFAGKWHLGKEGDLSSPGHHGFDVNVGGTHSGSPHGGFFAPFNNPKLNELQEDSGANLSNWLAIETSRFIETNRQTPFLAYLSFYAVHAPIQTTEGKWRKYRDRADSMGILENGFEMERILPIRTQQDNPVYGGLIEHVDEAVGSVMATLKRLGLDKNTVVIFTSDNGGVASGDNFSTSNLPLRGGKGYQWEGGIKVPFFINVPWLGPPKEVAQCVTGADIYPTILDLAGLPLRSDEHVDGRSLVPLLKRQAFEERPLFWHYPHYGNQGGEPHSIIRKGDWKLIHYWENSRDELYNLVDDKSEKIDLSNVKKKIAQEMNFQLMSWLRETQALFPVLNDEYDSLAATEVLAKFRLRKEQLERERLEMLQPNWQPNEDWWGSKVLDQIKKQ